MAVPAISAGIYGYPTDDATRVIAAASSDWCSEHPGALDEILLVGFDAATAEAFEVALSVQG